MVGDNIKRKRIEADMLQRELAKRLNVSMQTVSSWEIGRTEPNIGMLEEIAKVFNCTKLELVDGEKSDMPALISKDEELFLQAYRRATPAQRMLAYAELLKEG